MNPSLELRAVRKTFGALVAVDEISLAAEPGTIFGLLGPNGAGKTTTIRMIMDILAPDSGEVRFFGAPRGADLLDRVGYLPEERGLYRRMTVFDHLAFFGELHGMQRRDSRRPIGEWLERVGLAEWGERRVEELSKGMQQKVQLVGTVLHDPDVIVLDEPFSGLDPINQGLFKDLLAEYKARGKTILFSTHVMEQAEKLCDRICLISKGRAVLSGELAAIKSEFGGRTYRVEASGDLERLEGIGGVGSVLRQDGSVRLVLEPDAEPSRVLAEMVGFLEVREFRSAEPELEEIFISAVRDAA